MNNYDWFRLTPKKRSWWWGLLHLAEVRQRKRLAEATEKLLKSELEKMDFNKLWGTW